jgi:plastocyanin
MPLRKLLGGLLACARLYAAAAQTQYGHTAAVPKTHVVRMQGGHFAPFDLTIEKGDTVRFVLGAGGPHNVAFRETKGEAADRLRKLMSDQIGELAGPLLVIPGETYTIVFKDMPSGKYPYWCIPHLGMGMMGTIVVR